MAQQINLIDLRLMPRTVQFGGQHALYGVLGVLGVGTVAAVALQVLTQQTSAETKALQQRVASLQAAASAPAPARNSLQPELEQLRQTEAGQRRIQAALEAGIAGDREGPADYFRALARQAQANVWITGFSVADNGTALEIEGRMAETEQLPHYLRKLNHEPRFKGRPFAQLALNGVDKASGAPLPYTEFALRTRPMSGSSGQQASASTNPPATQVR
jgi:hypothetical protein